MVDHICQILVILFLKIVNYGLKDIACVVVVMVIMAIGVKFIQINLWFQLCVIPVIKVFIQYVDQKGLT